MAIVIVALAVTYSTAEIIHKNYMLQQQITELEQQNIILEQKNINQQLQNNYYQTDAYLELAARRYFNKSTPGETLVLVPENVSLSYTKEGTSSPQENTSSQPVFIKNWHKWYDFLSGLPSQT